MRGQRRKNRFHKRCTWGSIRSRARQRFSRGDYEVEPDWLRPERTAWDTWDASRIRWKLKNRRPRKRWSYDDIRMWLRGMHGADGLEAKYGIDTYRTVCCGARVDPGGWMTPWGMVRRGDGVWRCASCGRDPRNLFEWVVLRGDRYEGRFLSVTFL